MLTTNLNNKGVVPLRNTIAQNISVINNQDKPEVAADKTPQAFDEISKQLLNLSQQYPGLSLADLKKSLQNREKLNSAEKEKLATDFIKEFANGKTQSTSNVGVKLVLKDIANLLGQHPNFVTSVQARLENAKPKPAKSTSGGSAGATSTASTALMEKLSAALGNNVSPAENSRILQYVASLLRQLEMPEDTETKKRIEKKLTDIVDSLPFSAESKTGLKNGLKQLATPKAVTTFKQGSLSESCARLLAKVPAGANQDAVKQLTALMEKFASASNPTTQNEIRRQIESRIQSLQCSPDLCKAMLDDFAVIAITAEVESKNPISQLNALFNALDKLATMPGSQKAVQDIKSLLHVLAGTSDPGKKSGIETLIAAKINQLTNNSATRDTLMGRLTGFASASKNAAAEPAGLLAIFIGLVAEVDVVNNTANQAAICKIMSLLEDSQTASDSAARQEVNETIASMIESLECDSDLKMRLTTSFAVAANTVEIARENSAASAKNFARTLADVPLHPGNENAVKNINTLINQAAITTDPKVLEKIELAIASAIESLDSPPDLKTALVKDSTALMNASRSGSGTPIDKLAAFLAVLQKPGVAGNPAIQPAVDKIKGLIQGLAGSKGALAVPQVQKEIKTIIQLLDCSSEIKDLLNNSLAIATEVEPANPVIQLKVFSDSLDKLAKNPGNQKTVHDIKALLQEMAATPDAGKKSMIETRVGAKISQLFCSPATKSTLMSRLTAATGTTNDAVAKPVGLLDLLLGLVAEIDVVSKPENQKAVSGIMDLLESSQRSTEPVEIEKFNEQIANAIQSLDCPRDLKMQLTTCFAVAADNMRVAKVDPAALATAFTSTLADIPLKPGNEEALKNITSLMSQAAIATKPDTLIKIEREMVRMILLLDHPQELRKALTKECAAMINAIRNGASASIAKRRDNEFIVNSISQKLEELSTCKDQATWATLVKQIKTSTQSLEVSPETKIEINRAFSAFLESEKDQEISIEGQTSEMGDID